MRASSLVAGRPRTRIEGERRYGLIALPADSQEPVAASDHPRRWGGSSRGDVAVVVGVGVDLDGDGDVNVAGDDVHVAVAVKVHVHVHDHDHGHDDDTAGDGVRWAELAPG